MDSNECSPPSMTNIEQKALSEAGDRMMACHNNSVGSSRVDDDHEGMQKKGTGVVGENKTVDKDTLMKLMYGEDREKWPAGEDAYKQHMRVSEKAADTLSLWKRGGFYEEFRELDEVTKIIASLPDIYDKQIAWEGSYERFVFIIDQYQEQPHLIDPHLESLIGQLLDFIRNPKYLPDHPVIHLTFKLFYMITKMRGYKVIVRLLPHEVADVEPVLTLLAAQDKKTCQTWETRYMLLLWMSIVCMIPFDMVRLDSNARSESGETKRPVMERIIEAGKMYLGVTDKSRDAAAYALSRFMTRPDVRKEKLPEFLDWCMTLLHKTDIQAMMGMVAVSGVLTTLALLFKHGKREDLVGFAPVLLRKIQDLGIKHNANTVLRKLACKLNQRLGLIFLKARVAAWRYQRGSRSLADNLSQTTAGSKQAEVSEIEEEEEYDIPDEIEEIIEELLNGLRDPSTIVRWSAAKGVGRVTGRLPKELADEVVESIMGLFTIAETDAAWHGGCLALAELGRRGLLLPHRLSTVVPVIIKSLSYDEKRGYSSVGSHVRDAACYVCWAFARAYEPEDIKPYVNQIATALLIASLFDREVSVRRAASAAFQENVGRQGQFPYGIDILTTCDYFAVGIRNNCYLELSVFVSQFGVYTHAMIDHLRLVKLNHWEITMRELASLGLHNLASAEMDYMAQTVLPELRDLTTSLDLNQRHGAIIGAAEVTHALAKLAWQQNRTVVDVIGPDLAYSLTIITEKLQEAKLFLGVSGELMRRAVCCLIQKLSLSKIPFHESSMIESWQSMLEDCLEHIDPEVQKMAVKAIPAFVEEHLMESDGSVKSSLRERLLNKFVEELGNRVETTRMGYALGLGALPKTFLNGKLDVVMSALIANSRKTEKNLAMAESRRDALLALTSMCVNVGFEKTGSPESTLCPANIAEVYDAFYLGLTDYTLDSRGDVGAWVREASMSGLYEVTSLLMKTDPNLIKSDMSTKVFCHLVQQASEKIDRTRAVAGEIFIKLLHYEPEVPHIPEREQLKELFPKDKSETTNWAAPSVTFPKFTKLLSLPTYKYHVLLGLTVSIGGITESLVRHSAQSLTTYLMGVTRDKGKLESFSKDILQIFQDFQKQDRVSIPMLKMLDQLLAKGSFILFIDEENHFFPTKLFELTKAEIARSKDPQKILTSIEVFCGLLQFTGEVRIKTLRQLVTLMCHRYPKIRKNTANQLYEAIVTYEGVVEDEHLEEAMNILSETQWDNDVQEIRPLRNQICDILKIPIPVVKSAQKPGANGDVTKK